MNGLATFSDVVKRFTLEHAGFCQHGLRVSRCRLQLNPRDRCFSGRFNNRRVLLLNQRVDAVVQIRIGHREALR